MGLRGRCGGDPGGGRACRGRRAGDCSGRGSECRSEAGFTPSNPAERLRQSGTAGTTHARSQYGKSFNFDNSLSSARRQGEEGPTTRRAVCRRPQGVDDGWERGFRLVLEQRDEQARRRLTGKQDCRVSVQDDDQTRRAGTWLLNAVDPIPAKTETHVEAHSSRLNPFRIENQESFSLSRQ